MKSNADCAHSGKNLHAFRQSGFIGKEWFRMSVWDKGCKYKDKLARKNYFLILFLAAQWMHMRLSGPFEIFYLFLHDPYSKTVLL